MDFLEKLNYLMEQNGLNKNTLSKSCDIPYTTIDSWYKKGYDGLKLSTLRKLSNYFGTTLDYWATEEIEESNQLKTAEMITAFQSLCPEFQNFILEQVKKLAELQEKL